MSKNKKPVVCLCGGGTGTHILAGTIGSKENFIVNVFTRKPEKWTNEITVQSPSENKEYVGKINIVSSNPEEVFKDCDIFICNGPAMANPIYLKAMEPYLKDGAIIGSIFGQGGFDFAVLDIVGGRKEFEKRKLKVFSLKGIPWVCRTLEYGKTAKIVGKKARLQMAAIPKIKKIENELKVLCEELFDTPTVIIPNMLCITLVPGNQIIHSGRYYGLFSKWNKDIEYEEKDFPLMYQDFDDFSAEITQKLSDELLLLKDGIIEKFPEIDLSPIIDLKDNIYAAYKEQVKDTTNLKTVFCTNAAYAGITTPMDKKDNGKLIPALKSRVFYEDIPFGLLLLHNIGEILGIKTPTMDTCIFWAQDLMNMKYLEKDGKMNPEAIEDTGCPMKYGINTIEQLVNNSLDWKQV